MAVGVDLTDELLSIRYVLCQRACYQNFVVLVVDLLLWLVTSEKRKEQERRNDRKGR